MKLKEWLEETGLKGGWVAEKLGIRRDYFSDIVCGRRFGSLALRRSISAFTQGKVTLEEIGGPMETKKRGRKKRTASPDESKAAE